MEHLRVRLKMDEIDFASNHEKLVYLKNNHSQLIFHEPLHKSSLAMREAELQECLTGLQSRQAEALAAFFRESHVYAELLHGISALYSKLRGILMTTPYSFCDEEDKGSKGSEAERLEHRSPIKSLKGEHDAHPGRVHEADFVETPTSNGLDPMEMLEFCEERLLQLSAATVDVSVDLHDAAVKEKIQNLLEWDVQLEWHNCRINIGQQQQSEETMLSDEDEEDEGNSAPTNADIKMWGQRLIAMSARSSKKSNKRAKT
uniref:Uncharacterized protein n=1 Tax=Eptatretus burgeri TaxID=7764 RepID=A0A8C4NEE2_EPTBU